ncbi:MAG: DUF4142 domain-containing protein [Shinella sp.]|nr:DUF4142 domain-containing protein [Shinella sp.]
MAWPLLAMLAAACGQTSDGQGSGAETGSGPANGMATVAKTFEGPKPEGVSGPNEAFTRTYYIPAAANSDMYEIEAGKLAMERASRPEVKAFAQRMITDHEKTAKALRGFVESNPVNIAVPSHMDARRRAMIDNLESSSAQEFDRAYIGQQAAAHQEALNLHKSYASRGDDKKLAKVAQNTVAIVEHHAKAVTDLERAFGAGHDTR